MARGLVPVDLFSWVAYTNKINLNYSTLNLLAVLNDYQVVFSNLLVEFKYKGQDLWGDSNLFFYLKFKSFMQLLNN